MVLHNQGSNSSSFLQSQQTQKKTRFGGNNSVSPSISFKLSTSSNSSISENKSKKAMVCKTGDSTPLLSFFQTRPQKIQSTRVATELASMLANSIHRILPFVFFMPRVLISECPYVAATSISSYQPEKPQTPTNPRTMQHLVATLER